MLQKLIIKIRFQMFLFLLVATSMHSQSYLDEYDQLFIKKTKIINYHRPDNYFYISPVSSYFEIYPTIQQSQYDISMINKDNQIMICVAVIHYPEGKTRAQKYLIATEDLNRLNEKGLSSVMDTRLSKLIYIDAPHIKKMNANKRLSI